MCKLEQGRGKVGVRVPRKLRAVSTEPDTGLKLVNGEIMARVKIKSRTLNRLSPPGAPPSSFLSLAESVPRGCRTAAPISLAALSPRGSSQLPEATMSRSRVPQPATAHQILSASRPSDISSGLQPFCLPGAPLTRSDVPIFPLYPKGN